MHVCTQARVSALVSSCHAMPVHDSLDSWESQPEASPLCWLAPVASGMVYGVACKADSGFYPVQSCACVAEDKPFTSPFTLLPFIAHLTQQLLLLSTSSAYCMLAHSPGVRTATIPPWLFTFPLFCTGHNSAAASPLPIEGQPLCGGSQDTCRVCPDTWL